MNVLSYLTWLVHLTSVFEWLNIIYIFILYSKFEKIPFFKKFILSLIPSFCSALSVCTLHFFNNNESFYLLINFQSFLTLISNLILYISILIYKNNINKKKVLDRKKIKC
uniref:Uncharacterized protein n=1 Tax=Cyanophora biloba TaxID=1489483 RepID=A0A2Z4HGW5_9EUKA|nr:hypothetical protein [Cyanophora biloba]AWW13853.1 hypothetical protein [Cyanophora biloba]